MFSLVDQSIECKDYKLLQAHEELLLGLVLSAFVAVVGHDYGSKVQRCCLPGNYSENELLDTCQQQQDTLPISLVLLLLCCTCLQQQQRYRILFSRRCSAAPCSAALHYCCLPCCSARKRTVSYSSTGAVLKSFAKRLCALCSSSGRLLRKLSAPIPNNASESVGS